MFKKKKQNDEKITKYFHNEHDSFYNIYPRHSYLNYRFVANDYLDKIKQMEYKPSPYKVYSYRGYETNDTDTDIDRIKDNWMNV
jgi:hypothetical protein